MAIPGNLITGYLSKRQGPQSAAMVNSPATETSAATTVVVTTVHCKDHQGSPQASGSAVEESKDSKATEVGGRSIS